METKAQRGEAIFPGSHSQGGADKFFAPNSQVWDGVGGGSAPLPPKAEPLSLLQLVGPVHPHSGPPALLGALGAFQGGLLITAVN